MFDVDFDVIEIGRDGWAAGRKKKLLRVVAGGCEGGKGTEKALESAMRKDAVEVIGWIVEDREKGEHV